MIKVVGDGDFGAATRKVAGRWVLVKLAEGFRVMSWYQAEEIKIVSRGREECW